MKGIPEIFAGTKLKPVVFKEFTLMYYYMWKYVVKHRITPL